MHSEAVLPNPSQAVTLMSGSPFKWGLNPTMHALQSQPTISPILIHCIQRRCVLAYELASAYMCICIVKHTDVHLCGRFRGG